jgi:hypothetical protein
MRVGDKVRVVETGRVGWILAETATAWKIDFFDGDKPELVQKSVLLEVVEIKPNPNPNPNPRPKKRKPWGLIIILILVIGGAIALTIYNVAFK